MDELVKKLLAGRTPAVVAGVLGVAGVALSVGSATGHAPIEGQDASTLLGLAVGACVLVFALARKALKMDPPAPGGPSP